MLWSVRWLLLRDSLIFCLVWIVVLYVSAIGALAVAYCGYPYDAFYVLVVLCDFVLFSVILGLHERLEMI